MITPIKFHLQSLIFLIIVRSLSSIPWTMMQCWIFSVTLMTEVRSQNEFIQGFREKRHGWIVLWLTCEVANSISWSERKSPLCQSLRSLSGKITVKRQKSSEPKHDSHFRSNWKRRLKEKKFHIMLILEVLVIESVKRYFSQWWRRPKDWESCLFLPVLIGEENSKKSLVLHVQVSLSQHTSKTLLHALKLKQFSLKC